MTKIADQPYLLAEQYKDAANLTARIDLHRRFSTNSYGWQRWVFDHFDLPPQARLLELGCGPGDLWRENRRRLPASWDITLSDLSPGMLDQARAALDRVGLRFQVIDAQYIPYPDAHFDAVVANHMLYHVPDRAAALIEIRRVLRPGGRFYAATVGEGHMQELNDLLRPFMPASQTAFDGGVHFGLENGAAQLAPWFVAIQRDDYVDALVVTEAEPLIAYVRSTRGWSSLPDENIPALITQVEYLLSTRGAIRISKSSGLFVCLRA
jgi:ubiquinone/menaquinone biosynthesis C-methylase UbiE